MKLGMPLLFAVLVVYCFFLSLNPLGDSDLWFHLRTGQMTWETGQLPGEVDPFSFTTPNPIPPGILKGIRTQWLGQTLFYLVFDATSARGFAIVRSLMVVAPFIVFYLVALRRGASAAGLLFVVGLPLFLTAHASYNTFERPQAFSFLLAPVVYFLAVRLRRSFSIPFAVALGATMVLWANLHGGYIIGMVLIVCVAAGGAVSLAAARLRPGLGHFIGEPPDSPAAFFLALFAALLVTGINPAGLLVYDWALGLMKGILATAGGSIRAGGVMGGIQEYKPVWSFYDTPEGGRLYAVTAFYLLALMALGLKYAARRRVDLSEAFAIGFIVCFGMAYMRGVSFALILSSMLGSLALCHLSGRRLLSVSVPSALVMVLLAGTLAVGMPWMLNPRLPAHWVSQSFPEESLRFLDRNKVSGRMFNTMEWGGYIIWRSYPRRQVFFDGRQISPGVMREYSRVLEARPGWRGILDDYSVDVILIPLLHGSNGILTPPILRMAMEGPGPWRPVYMHHNQVVLVREGAEGAREALECCQMPFERLYGHMVEEAALMLLQMPGAPDVMISQALGFFWTGRSAEAIGVLSSLPDNPLAVRLRREILGTMGAGRGGDSGP